MTSSILTLRALSSVSDFAVVEVAGLHGGHVGARGLRPRTHAVRALAGVLLDRLGARRSELPSRSTGFTALPRILA